LACFLLFVQINIQDLVAEIREKVRSLWIGDFAEKQGLPVWIDRWATKGEGALVQMEVSENVTAPSLKTCNRVTADSLLLRD
jgi:hypothetical protein